MPQHYAYGFSPLLMTKRNKASLLSQTLQVASGKPQKRGGGWRTGAPCRRERGLSITHSPTASGLVGGAESVPCWSQSRSYRKWKHRYVKFWNWVESLNIHQHAARLSQRGRENSEIPSCSTLALGNRERFNRQKQQIRSLLLFGGMGSLSADRIWCVCVCLGARIDSTWRDTESRE